MCFDTWQRNNPKVGKNSQRWNSLEKKCKTCSKSIYVSPSRWLDGRGRYCSKKCYSIGMVGLNTGRTLSEETISKFSGKNHYNWKGGRSLINRKRLKNRKWEAIKKEIYKRDNRTCQNCKKYCNWMDISCHHIIPWRVSKNDSLSNLTTLCRSCHAKADLLSGIPRRRDDATPKFIRLDLHS